MGFPFAIFTTEDIAEVRLLENGLLGNLCSCDEYGSSCDKQILRGISPLFLGFKLASNPFGVVPGRVLALENPNLRQQTGVSCSHDHLDWHC